MMKVIEQKIGKKAVLFEDLKIGDVYRDKNGLICIKVSNSEAEDNSLTYGWGTAGEWKLTIEEYNAEVEPLEADLVIK